MAGPTTPGRLPIVIADDHAVLRRGLRALLEAEPDLSVAAEAADADVALRTVALYQPAVAVLDLNMPGTPTLEMIPELRRSAPDTAVVVLTMQAEPGFVRRALAAGALGYVLKDGAEAALVTAVRAAAAGRTYVDPGLGARLAESPPDGEPEVGTTFAGHRIDAVAGRGGMGVVFRATDLALQRTVALKVIAGSVAADPVFRMRFERECRAAAAIDDPHVVSVFQAGEERGLLYLTMRYVEGTDLRSELDTSGRLAPARAVAIAADVASALDAAHALGLVHRDVKPANVLLGERDRAYLTDFGVTSEPAAAQLTGAGMAIGTADYMAPEQAAGRPADARSDVYALGCVLYESLTGSVVHPRETALDVMWAQVHEPPPSARGVRPELGRALDAVLARALAKDPGERFASAGAFARAVADAL